MAVIGNNGRKSVVDESAALGRPETERSERQKWSELNTGQRFRYFIDYYLLKSILIVGVFILVSLTLWTMLKPKPETVLSVAVVSDTLIPDEKEHFQEYLEQLCITDSKHQIVQLDDSFGMGYEGVAKLQAYLGAKQLDILIANEDYFKQLAEAGYFMDLNQILPELTTAWPDKICWAAGTSDSDTTLDSESSLNQLQAYGIRITDCTEFSKTWYGDTEAVAGIVVNTEQLDNAKKTLKDLFS